MSDITVILLGAGSSSRFGLQVKKQWLWIGDEPLWLFGAKRFASWGFSNLIVTAPPNQVPLFRRYCDFPIVPGGRNRQESIQHALAQVQTPYVLISDIARICVPKELVERILFHKGEASCVAPAITPPDTIVYRNETIDRSAVRLVQTPQLSKTSILAKALQQEEHFTDESSAIRALGERVLYIEGDRRALKLTFKEDLPLLTCLTPPSAKMRHGFGLDVHPFTKQRPLILCGLSIPHAQGLAGHSDADVAIHALIDALLGAAGFGDIGALFPDTDPTYKGADSMQLLAQVVQLLHETGFTIEQVDLTIAAQAPKLAPFKEAMERNLATTLQIPLHRVNLKATTTEGLGFIGRQEGIGAMAVATLGYFDWSRQ
ncbi:MAG: bifunctional 2-C-methyl-D-erythritol 4-phosphate cytidylyltransferase/2-C-methyl-D-erythritol 2,4-cyclodiphosphate synthase [Nitratiruptor sp.]|nr:bifunctional 2-C-methyl-D-erythritol 4-phosphate cytidylyltransferase/2-C-methyl-D-erythritol 2,4-cyclodiphosphate synthase [Nitratiruptor sp.]NPA84238.1 bifunctional 2-C-methyl-D-erythritol 4-phosphate cytidylyltransferase/2-C-methyl-D-erythritol 2,4-cyclodiphosphate synthase [Campylobacterota bacterium]